MPSKNATDIYNNVILEAEALGITNISPISPVHVLADRFGSYMGDLYNHVDVVDAETDVSNKSGDELTALASKAGIQRTTSTPLQDNTFQNFNFYLNGKKTRDITVDTTHGFTIPAGTTVRSTNGISFYTVDPAVFSPDDTQSYVRVYATNDTIDASLDIDTLIDHDASLGSLDNIDIDKIDAETLLCTNDSPISSESSTFTDEELRILLRYNFNSLSRINEDRLRLAVMSVAGVSDMRIIENYNGIGNTAVIVVPVNNIGSEGLYSAVERSIRSRMVGGDTIIVIRPEYLSVFIKIALQLSEAVVNTDEVYTEIKEFIGTFVNAIPQGGSLDPAVLEQELRTAYSELISIVQVTCLYINDMRALLQKQETFEDQKFIMYNARNDVSIN